MGSRADLLLIDGDPMTQDHRYAEHPGYMAPRSPTHCPLMRCGTLSVKTFPPLLLRQSGCKDFPRELLD